jgi:hypothetical protein
MSHCISLVAYINIFLVMINSSFEPSHLRHCYSTLSPDSDFSALGDAQVLLLIVGDRNHSLFNLIMKC